MGVLAGRCSVEKNLSIVSLFLPFVSTGLIYICIASLWNEVVLRVWSGAVSGIIPYVFAKIFAK